MVSMSLAEYKFKISYNNQEHDIIHEFLLPALKEGVEYDRAVGFFSSTSLMSMSVGIKQLIKNGGRIKMICSPKLSEEDYEAIRAGYELRQVVENSLHREFYDPKDEFERERLNILSHLISDGLLDIKIATIIDGDNNSMFHAKIGVITDANGNYVAFTGSMNDSYTAFFENGESIDVYSSIGADYERAFDKKRYFMRLWNNEENRLEVLDFPDSIRKRIDLFRKAEVDYDIDKKEAEIKWSRTRKNSNPKVPSFVEMRDYQKEAYENWKDNNFRGIYDMATGTGKTYTALYSIVNILKEKKQKLGIVICCPYQHLVNQWSEDLEEFNFKYIMGFSSSKQKDWKKRLQKDIFNYSHKVKDSFCFITTNSSFASKYVQEQLDKVEGELLLVVDEAHNFGTRRLLSTLDDRFTYRLALSATLDRHNDFVGTQQLYDYFECKCIEYSLAMAIEAGMLCKYYYHPILVHLSEKEYEEYNRLSEELVKYIRHNPDGTVEYTKRAEMLLIQRSRLVAGARMKLDKLKEIATQFVDSNHLLVYCGAATIFDADYDENNAGEEEKRQVDEVSKILFEIGITCSTFTSEEDAATREILKREFDSGDVIQALVAIRCLDEGVNIPSIDKAIILASSTNPKEYIQRRGRVLRNHKDKLHATIFDFVTLPRDLEEVLPTSDFKFDLGLIKREICRVKDFARLSLNEYDSDELISEIESVYGYIQEDEEYE